jgi:hypothetical protein
MRRRPGTPSEMRSDLPSQVMSVRTKINATRAMVRRRGTVNETYSPHSRPARSEPFGSALGPPGRAEKDAAELLESRRRRYGSGIDNTSSSSTVR